MLVCFLKQKVAYEVRISDWSADVCFSDRKAIVVDHQQQTIAIYGRGRRGEVERHDRNIFARDILPDVELGPVRDREHADALALRLAGVVEVPELGTLLLGVPAVGRGAKGEDAIPGETLFLVEASADAGYVAAVDAESLDRKSDV